MAPGLAIFLSKLRALFGRTGSDSEFTHELQIHLQLLTERFVGQEMRPEAASTAARRQFGNSTLIDQRRREMRTFLSLAILASDLRFSVRQLRRNPLLTLIAVSSLALGIDANKAIFSVAKKVLFDTLPVRHPQELRMLTWVSGHQQPVPPVWGDVSSTSDGGLTSNAFSYPVLEALRRYSGAFAQLIAFKDIPITATVDGTPELIVGEMVSGNAFGGLGVEPLLDRRVSLATGFLFGALPAWRAMSADVSGALKDSVHATSGRQGMWLGKGLVAFQIALSAVLLIGAGLFVPTLVHLNHTALGFRADHLLLFQLNLPRTDITTHKW